MLAEMLVEKLFDFSDSGARQDAALKTSHSYLPMSFSDSALVQTFGKSVFVE